ncbi:MAG TPA: hypothetical protein PKZ53_24660, partial [Acidobacteriota bacterium]|nr:hypothetical protein [Acidobacteriota bacterium]
MFTLLCRNRLIPELVTSLFKVFACPKRWVMASAVVAGLVWFSTPTLAQSAIDEFNPNANNQVTT